MSTSPRPGVHQLDVMETPPAFLTNPTLIRPPKHHALPVTSPRKRVRTVPCMKKGVFNFGIPRKYMTPELLAKFPEQKRKPPEKTAKPEVTDLETPETVDDAVEVVRRHLGARIDVVILGVGSTNRFQAALQSHHHRFNALVLAPTRISALAAVAEIGEFSGSSRVIPVVGRGPHSLSNPARTAMYQNNVGKGSVVVATPRGLCSSFFKTGQGPKWLGLVERLVLYDPEFIHEIGCLPHLTKILKYIPPTARRQTVLITQQYPGKNTSRLILSCLRNNTRFLKWPVDDETPEALAKKINRRYAVASEIGVLAALAKAIEDAMKVTDYKIVVFMNNTKLVQLYAALWRRMGVYVDELHGKRSNASQMRALVLFAEKENTILFSTEMSAQRAADMRVTHVIELGPPSSKAVHEQRVSVATPGVGSSLLLVTDYEREMAFSALGEETVNQMTVAECYMNYEDEEFMQRMHVAFGKAQWQLGAAAYMNYIAHYSSLRKKFGWTKQDLVQRAAQWCRHTLGAGPWAITPRYADRFKLWNTEGVEVDPEMTKLLSVARVDGPINVDHSLDGLDPRLGPRGKNVRPRKLKEKKLRIGNWEEIMKKVKEDEMRMLEKLNRKSPEGRKYMALIAQKAIQRTLTPKKGEAKKRKKELAEKQALLGKRRKSRIRLRVRDWAPNFADKE